MKSTQSRTTKKSVKNDYENGLWVHNGHNLLFFCATATALHFISDAITFRVDFVVSILLLLPILSYFFVLLFLSSVWHYSIVTTDGKNIENIFSFYFRWFFFCVRYLFFNEKCSRVKCTFVFAVDTETQQELSFSCLRALGCRWIFVFILTCSRAVFTASYFHAVATCVCVHTEISTTHDNVVWLRCTRRVHRTTLIRYDSIKCEFSVANVKRQEQQKKATEWKTVVCSVLRLLVCERARILCSLCRFVVTHTTDRE